MNIRTVRYLVKEGIINTYKNKIMSLASIGIVFASLFVFGLFWILLINLSYNTEVVRSQPEMQVFCEYELDDAQIDQVRQQILNNPNIESCKLVTPKEAFDKYKKDLGEDADILEGFDESLMSASFIIKLHDTEISAQTMEDLMKINGVRKVSYSKDIVDFIAKLSRWVNVVSFVLIIVLMSISTFIIANTIKLTVFARRKEINIMKYIGATDWFIRLPFIIEGAFIGLVGVVVSLIILHSVYGASEVKFNQELLAMKMYFIRLVPANTAIFRMLPSFLLLGAGVGTLGSVLSLRKHLKV